MAWGKKRQYNGAHVFITGGSTGIGLEISKQFLRLGAKVTIVARTQSKLDAADKELKHLLATESLPGQVLTISADVSSNTNVIRSIKEAEDKLGPISVAISAAGACFPGKFVEQDLELFEKSMQLDYYGALYLAKAVLPAMLKANSGQIMFIASPLALAGIVGYSTYSPAKAALRTLADCLRNELAGTEVKISVGYPLDTDTPGFATENLTKPPESGAIAQAASGPVYSAELVAKSLVTGLQKEQYHIKTPEFIMNLLISASSNITPKPYFILLEMLWAPILVVILAGYGWLCDSLVKKQRKKDASLTASRATS